MAGTASQALTSVRAFLDEAGLPPDAAQEYYIAPGELDDLRTRLTEETRGNFHVMSKEEAGQLHVIAFLNIRGMGDLFHEFEAEHQVQPQDGHPPSSPAAGAADSELEF